MTKAFTPEQSQESRLNRLLFDIAVGVVAALVVSVVDGYFKPGNSPAPIIVTPAVTCPPPVTAPVTAPVSPPIDAPAPKPILVDPIVQNPAPAPRPAPSPAPLPRLAPRRDQAVVPPVVPLLARPVPQPRPERPRLAPVPRPLRAPVAALLRFTTGKAYKGRVVSVDSSGVLFDAWWALSYARYTHSQIQSIETDEGGYRYCQASAQWVR